MISSRELVADWRMPDLAPPPPVSAEEIDNLEANAWSRGWEEGHAAARDEAAQMVAAAESATRAATLAAETVAVALQVEFRVALPALALAIARVLLEREVAADPEVMAHLVTRALGIVPLHGAVSVRLHPDDLAVFDTSETAAISASGIGELRWLPDATLTRGSCVVDGPSSIVDGRVDRVLLDLYERLTRD